MTAVDRGIVLDDAETAAVVPNYAVGYWRDDPPGRTYMVTPEMPDRSYLLAADGWVLTHLPTPTGLRPVDELVAEADEAEADAEVLRGRAEQDREDAYQQGKRSAGANTLDAIAARIDERRAKAIDARLVAAWHAQWADTEVVERG